MKLLFLTICFTFLLGRTSIYATPADDHKTLAIGTTAPDFRLPGVDGKMYSLASFSKAKILVIVFTCNHCPTAQAYEDRIKQLARDYTPKGVAVVAVMPNDPKAVRLDELGYTDLSDSFEEMKLRAKDHHFNFPYLFDGNTESMARAYGPVATPHVFIFDAQRKLQYQGRVDDVEKPSGHPNSEDARNAIEQLLVGKDVVVKTTKVFGCSIKWSEKSNWVEKAAADWAAEPVAVNKIDVKGLKELRQNKSDKLRVINVWATWCGPCVAEFSEFVKMYHMYRNRDFELISISADDLSHEDKVLQFLKKQHASNTNYLFTSTDKYALIDAVDPNWPGALPYTMVVEPGGKTIYAKEGIIDPIALRKIIIEDSFMGRYY
jgi:peroxiredoxin